MRIKWSRWIPWDDLHRARRVPIHDCPGVYEARRRDTGDSRLHTGKATHLRARIKSGLVRGTLPHSAGADTACRGHFSRRGSFRDHCNRQGRACCGARTPSALSGPPRGEAPEAHEAFLIGDLGRFWDAQTVRGRAQRAAGQEWNPRFPGR